MNLVLLVCVLTAGGRILGTLSHGVANWYKFATSESYENSILVLEFSNILKFIYVPKDESQVAARMKCSQECALLTECEAFNIYDNGNAYVCQLLPDSFCTQKWLLTLQIWPGGSVWDKLRPSASKTCLDQRFEGQQAAKYCGIAFRGCRGTWPACTDCVLSCFHCRSLITSSYGGTHRCTIWPEGPTLRPIFALCYDFATFIIFRSVDVTQGYDRINYRMPVEDIGRLSKVNIYHGMQLYLRAADRSTFIEDYRFNSIDNTGRVNNLSWVAFLNRKDGFGLKGNTVSLDFVQVSSDPYGCGSFWLLDPNNATYCPGGSVSFLGTFRKSGSWVSTGIRWPPAGNKIMEQGDIKLTP